MKAESLVGNGVEFAILHFRFECHHDTRLTIQNLLQLRRELHPTARRLFALERSEVEARARFAALFDPPLADDPVALRRYQRPGPPFVLVIDPETAGTYRPGDHWELKVLFWGDGAQRSADFARVLQAQARSGFGPGLEAGELVAIESEDASGQRASLWQEGRPLAQLIPVFCELGWWLGNRQTEGFLRLELVTPARLLSAGRPLFRPSFAQLFPFILRRVSSMCHAHCALELIADPLPLLEAAAQVRVMENSLAWTDWRALDRGDESFDLGGLTGGLTLGGAALREIAWVLQVGSLLNLGKGAAFGAGGYRLLPRGPFQ